LREEREQCTRQKEMASLKAQRGERTPLQRTWKPILAEAQWAKGEDESKEIH
jgi:hypothetical protein